MKWSFAFFFFFKENTMRREGKKAGGKLKGAKSEGTNDEKVREPLAKGGHTWG